MVILIADDEISQRTTLDGLFRESHHLILCEDGASALAALDKNSVDLVITDYQMPKLSGLDLIRKGKAVSPGTSFILMTAYGSVDHAVEAIRAGAEDYLVKPFELDEMEHRVRRIEELRIWKYQTTIKAEAGQTTRKLIGKSAAVANAMSFVERVAKARSPVLLLGPTGAGKEVLAQSIHDAGPGVSRPFVAVNCASLGPELMESELFGHEKGSFTGAIAAKPGKFELASGGTIFLDEVGEISLPLQAKLLRVLQEKEFFRVGGLRVIKSDARVIAATHRPLKDMVKAGTFREDLFFRLNILTYELAPLCERRDDIPILIDFFLDRFSRELGNRIELNPEARALMLRYNYPGNIRELQNVLERLTVLGGPMGKVGPELLPAEFHASSSASAMVSSGTTGIHRVPEALGSRGLTEMVEELESRLIRDAMKACGNNQAKAAEMLRIPRGTLQYKLKRLAGQAGSGEPSSQAA
jgi:two-component system NtrC family response regulator